MLNFPLIRWLNYCLLLIEFTQSKKFVMGVENKGIGDTKHNYILGNTNLD